MHEKRKLVLVGTGFVGMSMAYTFISTGGLDELVLIDLDTEKAIGEVMDLQHALPYSHQAKMVIKAGGYEECEDASIVVITAGAPQKPGETRLDLTAKNTRIIRNITEQVMESGFNGIFIIASNPVDLMTLVVSRVSGLPHNRVIGSGTILDTARLRHLMSEYLGVSSKNIHAYIMGEHGDSSFVPWVHAYVGCKNLLELLDDTKRNLSDLHEIYYQVQQSAYEIINRKRATYYGIGLALNRLVLAILDNENCILTVSAYQNGEYGHKGFYTGVPAVINRQGIQSIVKLKLTESDQDKFDNSCETLKKYIKESVEPTLEE